MSTVRVGKPTADSFAFAHVRWARHDLVSRLELGSMAKNGTIYGKFAHKGWLARPLSLALAPRTAAGSRYRPGPRAVDGRRK